MNRFAASFLVVFGELAFGGTLALSIPPFFQVERGFYKSSAGVYLAAGLFDAIGLAMLAGRAQPSALPSRAGLWASAALWGVFCLVLGAYLYTLWTERGYLRARAYTVALACGLGAVIASVLAIAPAPAGVLFTLSYCLSAIASSLVLGLVSGGLMFGHWYLIDPNLPVEYLRGLVRMLGIALVAELAVVALIVGVLGLFGSAPARAAVRALLGAHMPLLGMRLGLGPAASIALVWMTWRTLEVPQTMAATGLLYITLMSVIVGELLGRFIMFRTALPL